MFKKGISFGSWIIEDTFNFRDNRHVVYIKREGLHSRPIARMVNHSGADAKLISMSPALLKLIKKCSEELANSDKNNPLIEEISEVLSSLQSF